MYIIAHIRNDYSEKFGVPRQSGLVNEVVSRIVFEPEFRNPDALRGLSEFSHIWLIWEFSQAIRKKSNIAKNIDEQTNIFEGKIAQKECSETKEGTTEEKYGTYSPLRQSEPDEIKCDWRPTVRPPRLGGNTRIGVFATRSPFRPNPIGLSCVELDSIDFDAPDGPVILVRGADLVDGTPIYDIKPYLPYADCKPCASGGFTDFSEKRSLQVILPDSIEKALGSELARELKAVLEQDPRPAYQDDPNREYTFTFAGREIAFRAKDGKVTDVRVVSC